MRPVATPRRRFCRPTTGAGSTFFMFCTKDPFGVWTQGCKNTHKPIPWRAKTVRTGSLGDNFRLADRKNLHTQPGLSIAIIADSQDVLFDTGRSGLFRSIARQLGMKIADITLAVLPDRHFDHGGGLAVFPEANDRARIHLGSRSPGQRAFTCSA